MKEGGVLVLGLEKKIRITGTPFFCIMHTFLLPFLPFWPFCPGDPVVTHEAVFFFFLVGWVKQNI